MADVLEISCWTIGYAANVKNGGAGVILTLYALTSNWKNHFINEKKNNYNKSKITNVISHGVEEPDILNCQARRSMESSHSGKICKHCLDV